MMSEVTPTYPEQGTRVIPHSQRTLLPSGYQVKDSVLLFVHAHPDDETTATGATMAAYAREGAKVHLLTLTRGEMGEVIPQHLRHLAVGNPGCTDNGQALGEYRTGELEAATAQLGVASRFFLGQKPAFAPAAKSLYRDSGMVWGADGKPAPNPAASSDSLTAQPVEPQAQAIANAIKAVKPDVLITYDADGGYGHPDHKRTYEAVMAALGMLNNRQKPLLTWGVEGEFDREDQRTQAAIYGSGAAKRQAMQAHATQITVTSEKTFEYSNGVEQNISAIETYRLLDGEIIREMGSKPEPAGILSTTFTALLIGVMAGLAGSIYHAWVFYADNTLIPVGLLLGYLVVFCASLWSTTVMRRLVAVPLAAAAAFAAVFVLAYARPDAPFVLVNPSAGVAIGVVGTWWLFGAPVAALLAIPVADRVIKREEKYYGARHAPS